MRLYCRETNILQDLNELSNSILTGEKNINYDSFFTGISLERTLNDVNIDLFGCWNAKCEGELKAPSLRDSQRELLKSFHLNSIHQAQAIKLMESYHRTITGKNKVRITFGDNIYYTKETKKKIKEVKGEIKKLQFTDIEKKSIGEVLRYLGELDRDSIPSEVLDKLDIEYTKPVQTAVEIIDTGYKCLPLKPTFISLGNHDVEFEYILQAHIVKSFAEGREIRGSWIDFKSWILPNAFYSVKFKIKGKYDILFIFIDTNLLSPDEYSYLGDKKAEYGEKMKDWFEKTLQKNKDCLKFVVGHEPIFNYKHYKEEDKEGGKKDKKEKKGSKEKKGDKEEKKLALTKLEFYDLMKNHNVSAYFCADEHNFQWLTDDENRINHLICGTSPGGGGGDMAKTFENETLYFSNFPLPFLEENFSKRMVINAPTFMNMIIHDNLAQINVVSGKNLFLHNKSLCKKDVGCEGGVNTTFEDHSIYEIVSIPKYKDYVAIYNCEGYKENYMKKQCRD